MKSTIQAEAEKAAKKIREALEEFNRVTGLSLHTEVRWYEGHSTGDTCGEMRLADVTLRIGGREVRA